jgi:hypothetical protein
MGEIVVGSAKSRAPSPPVIPTIFQDKKINQSGCKERKQWKINRRYC